MLPGPQSWQPVWAMVHCPGNTPSLAGAGRQTGEMPPPARTQSPPVGDETVPGCISPVTPPSECKQREDASRGPLGRQPGGGRSCQGCVRTSAPQAHGFQSAENIMSYGDRSVLASPVFCPVCTGRPPSIRAQASGGSGRSLNTRSCLMLSNLW